MIEAMAAGLPIVATDAPGVPDMVGKGPDAAGIVVPVEDPDALAGAVLSLLADPHRAAALGAAGRRRILSEALARRRRLAAPNRPGRRNDRRAGVGDRPDHRAGRSARALLGVGARLRPPPAEILVVDQSGGTHVERLSSELGAPVRSRGVRWDRYGSVDEHRTGCGEARHDPRYPRRLRRRARLGRPWWAHAQAYPAAIVTGRVLPPEGAGYVPSTKTDTEPEDYTGRILSGVLYPANMVADRRGSRRSAGSTSARA